MEFGLGTDIEEIDRFRSLSSPEIATFLTPSEREYCNSCEDPAPHIAARFAGKEACIKAVSQLTGRRLGFLDMAISRRDDGAPMVNILVTMQEPVEVSMSLAHSRSDAVAIALATFERFTR